MLSAAAGLPPAPSGPITRAAASKGAAPPADAAPSLDQTDNYNTPLEPKQETQFQSWRTALAASPKTADLANMQDYDLRGAWKANASAAANGHLPDTWKKPNAPTFSDESIYHGPYTPGGKWVQTGPKSAEMPEGVWRFDASPHNLKYRSAEDLARYFATVEKGNKLVLPGGK